MHVLCTCVDSGQIVVFCIDRQIESPGSVHMGEGRCFNSLVLMSFMPNSFEKSLVKSGSYPCLRKFKQTYTSVFFNSALTLKTQDNLNFCCQLIKQKHIPAMRNRETLKNSAGCVLKGIGGFAVLLRSSTKCNA